MLILFDFIILIITISFSLSFLHKAVVAHLMNNHIFVHASEGGEKNIFIKISSTSTSTWLLMTWSTLERFVTSKVIYLVCLSVGSSLNSFLLPNVPNRSFKFTRFYVFKIWLDGCCKHHTVVVFQIKIMFNVIVQLFLPLFVVVPFLRCF